MCLRFQFCTHQRVCILHFLKKSQIRCTLVMMCTVCGVWSSMPHYPPPFSLEVHYHLLKIPDHPPTGSGGHCRSRTVGLGLGKWLLPFFYLPSAFLPAPMHLVCQELFTSDILGFFPLFLLPFFLQVELPGWVGVLAHQTGVVGKGNKEDTPERAQNGKKEGRQLAENCRKENLLGLIVGKEFAEKWKKVGTELNGRGQIVVEKIIF